MKVEYVGGSFFPIRFFWRGKPKHLHLSQATALRDGLDSAIKAALVDASICKTCGRIDVLPEGTTCAKCLVCQEYKKLKEMKQ